MGILLGFIVFILFIIFADDVITRAVRSDSERDKRSKEVDNNVYAKKSGSKRRSRNKRKKKKDTIYKRGDTKGEARVEVNKIKEDKEEMFEKFDDVRRFDHGSEYSSLNRIYLDTSEGGVYTTKNNDIINSLVLPEELEYLTFENGERNKSSVLLRKKNKRYIYFISLKVRGTKRNFIIYEGRRPKLNERIIKDYESAKQVKVLKGCTVLGESESTIERAFSNLDNLEISKSLKLEFEERKKEYRDKKEFFRSQEFREKATNEMNRLNKELKKISSYEKNRKKIKFAEDGIRNIPNLSPVVSLDLHGFTRKNAGKALRKFFAVVERYTIPHVSVIYGLSGDVMEKETDKFFEDISTKRYSKKNGYVSIITEHMDNPDANQIWSPIDIKREGIDLRGVKPKVLSYLLEAEIYSDNNYEKIYSKKPLKTIRFWRTKYVDNSK